jgi:hypothetical protein
MKKFVKYIGDCSECPHFWQDDISWESYCLNPKNGDPDGNYLMRDEEYDIWQIPMWCRLPEAMEYSELDSITSGCALDLK